MQRSEPELEQAVRNSTAARREIQAIADAARARHGWLAHQDTIGLTIFLVSTGAVLGGAAAYAYGVLPAWLAVVSAAFFMSLLHELEHDLIHRLYFKDHPVLYATMMVGVWLLRPSTINPFVRRDWHLHHHRVSGTATDLEERALANGERWGPRRLFMTFDSFLAFALRPRTAREMLLGYASAQKPKTHEEYMRIRLRNLFSPFPLGHLHFGIWYLFLFVHALGLLSPSLAASLPDVVQRSMSTVDFLVVVLVIPNVLRSFCLHFVSSNIHYYEDIESRNIVQQTQVWCSPWVIPLQLFCFNFGSTHAIHHFVVQEPFYLRQLIAGEAHKVMREHGVRFNDFGTLLRANRWTRVHQGAKRPLLVP
ncbi:MAG: fatty acid desaturase [Myxococcales bacterium]